MSTLMPWLNVWRDWFGSWHPRRRRALAKRRLEVVCRQYGSSRSQAERIATEYFR